MKLLHIDLLPQPLGLLSDSEVREEVGTTFFVFVVAENRDMLAINSKGLVMQNLVLFLEKKLSQPKAALVMLSANISILCV
jgi:hypothetical protein